SRRRTGCAAPWRRCSAPAAATSAPPTASPTSGSDDMRSEQRFQQILTLVGGFLMPLGLAVIGIGWYGTAHTGYVFEQLPYLVSGGLFGLGLTICGALVFF